MFWYSYILFIIIIGGILVVFIYITRLASKEIFSPSDKIHREVGRAKDFSAPGNILCNKSEICVISSNRWGVNEVFALLRCYAAFIGSYLPTFRDSLALLPSMAYSWRWDRYAVQKRWKLTINQCCVTSYKIQDLN